MLSDLNLLQIEIETLWVSDDRGRLLQARERNGRPAPHLVIAAAGDEQIAAFGSEVPDDVALALQAAIEASPDAAARPALLSRCEQLLRDRLGRVRVFQGPTYVVPPGTAFDSPADIARSDGRVPDALRGHAPPPHWGSEEWQLLLDGALGPWAIATAGGRAVSICHTSRLGDRGAEAGVWTDPGHRGRGLAAAVTAAWASLLEPGGRYLFYSTSADNLSSQRVAARLNLRPIGWRWQFVSADDG